MPSAAPRPCRRAGCAAVVTAKDGWCDSHRRAVRRADTRERRDELRFYGTARWKKLRALVLSREPLCRTCSAEGRVTAATAVDHIERIKAGGNPFDMKNLAPICNQCHACKRGREAHDA